MSVHTWPSTSGLRLARKVNVLREHVGWLLDITQDFGLYVFADIGAIKCISATHFTAALFQKPL